MLEKVAFRTFKSLKDVSVDLGLINVFIGANGSGKSNLLEALGVLSAAADGKVDDQALLARGVRPGTPALYKSAFPSQGSERIPPHLFFGAYGDGSKYEVTLHNPLNDPAPAWRFKLEVWEDADGTYVSRAPAQREKPDPERGWAALKLVEVEPSAGIALLKRLQNYVIFTPTTSVLRGVSEGALYVLFLAVMAGDDRTPKLCAVDNADHGLNPRLARSLMNRFCDWMFTADGKRRVLMTTHNPLVLDGLPLQNEDVRLFTVSRTRSGSTCVRRVVVDDQMLAKAEQGWTLSRLWTMGHLGGVPNV